MGSSALQDFLDAVYQYPGGWVADRLGRRRGLLIFLGLACVGYLIYLFGSSWPLVFVGLGFAMAWPSMASPATFAVIGDALPPEKRAMGFSIQSILKRVPLLIAPIIGGAIIAKLGIVSGVRVGLIVTLGFAALTALLLRFISVVQTTRDTVNIFGVWSALDGGLKRLLASDIFIRVSEGMADVLVIIYVTNVLHITVARFGVLLAILFLTTILVYIPAAKGAERFGRRPFIIATFCAFALYPLAIIGAGSFPALVVAFIIGGLREIGEPARKAMIVDFAQPRLRARTVGLYYLLRSLAITPAAAIGGLLWKVTPQMPFAIAGAFGIVGTFIFVLAVKERVAK